MHLAVAIRADAALFIPISPSLTQCTQTMDTLKRVFSHRRSKDTGTHPVPTKRYCRYPACGQPFYTTDPIKEFCSSECLQDFNWRPPPQYFRDVPGYERSPLWWPRRRKDPDEFCAMQQYAIAARYIPIPSAHGDSGRGADRSHAHAPATQEAHRPKGHSARAAELASKPLPQPPPHELVSSSTRRRSRSRSRHRASSRGPSNRRHQDRHHPAPLRPQTSSRDDVPRSRPSRTVHLHAQQPSLDHGLVQHFGGVDEGGWPLGVPVYMEPAPARAYQRVPPPTPPPLLPLPAVPSSALPRPAAAPPRCPRPRSNSFGGFSNPAVYRGAS
ncbi:hypothetical protein PYCCODRAFT_617246 [Trametes coccinea BRFM310]|uniref:Uncharacterized protein n=1 Tax=Trametes coccinea (strain BRFM310) TaxID=1353009 RepID=A0A1Y2J4V5_TRAC3|nr:hypothetical protein PYCCODRAFT_617246 [Trametes coccinea BRFM310]